MSILNIHRRPLLCFLPPALHCLSNKLLKKFCHICAGEENEQRAAGFIRCFHVLTCQTRFCTWLDQIIWMWLMSRWKDILWTKYVFNWRILQRDEAARDFLYTFFFFFFFFWENIPFFLKHYICVYIYIYIYNGLKIIDLNSVLEIFNPNVFFFFN